MISIEATKKVKTQFKDGDILKGVIFDMDGVIIDSEPVHVKLEREILEEAGGDYSKIKPTDFMGTTDAELWRTLKERFNLALSVEELVNQKRERFIENLDQIPLVDHVLAFMAALRNNGYKLGLASSNNKRAVEAVKNRFGLAKFIDVFINGEIVSKGKPDPEIFLIAAKEMGLKPADCIVVEDTRNGVLAAKKAGMKCIGYRNKNSGVQDLSAADLIVSSYKELTPEDVNNLFR